MPYYLIQYYAAQLGECQKFWYRIFGLKYPTTTLPTKCSQTHTKGCTVKIRLSFLKIFIIDIFVSECPLCTSNAYGFHYNCYIVEVINNHLISVQKKK